VSKLKNDTMNNITFDTLPQAVTQLFNKLENIEQILLYRSKETEPKDQWLNLTELCLYRPDKPAKATVYSEVHNGLIPFHKRGKKLYFLKSEIDAWLSLGRHRTKKEILSEAIEIKEG
jgi:hypothetical protein